MVAPPWASPFGLRLVALAEAAYQDDIPYRSPTPFSIPLTYAIPRKNNSSVNPTLRHVSKRSGSAVLEWQVGLQRDFSVPAVPISATLFSAGVGLQLAIRTSRKTMAFSFATRGAPFHHTMT